MTVMIEADAPLNRCMNFRPIQKRLRGRYCATRDSQHSRESGIDEIAGQRISYDPDRQVGCVIEPLHDGEHEVVREQVEAKGFRLAPEFEEFTCDPDTAHYWMKRAVDSGAAKLISGKFPKIDEAKVVKNFTTKEVAGPMDKLTAAIENQTAAFEKLINKLSG